MNRFDAGDLGVQDFTARPRITKLILFLDLCSFPAWFSAQEILRWVLPIQQQCS